MGGANQFWNSSNKRVNVNICGQVSSFYQNLCRYQVLYVVVLWLLSYVSSNDKKKKKKKEHHGQNAKINFFYNLAKKW